MKGAFVNSDVRIVRGVNIATLVFSVMGALIGGALVALLLSASSMLSDPDFFDMFVQELQAESSGSAAFDGNSAANSYDYSSMSEEEIRGAASFGMNIVIALAVGYLLLSVVGIVASILTLRALSTPEKLRGAFGWTVAAAVCAAVTFSVITCVCFIISAWLISRIRKNFAGYGQGFPYQAGMPGQPGMYQGAPGQMNVPSQTMPGQPGGFANGGMPNQPQMPQQPIQPQGGIAQQPVGQPVQPPAQQPQQPQPQLPTDSQQPVQPEQPEQSAQQGQPQQSANQDSGDQNK